MCKIFLECSDGEHAQRSMMAKNTLKKMSPPTARTLTPLIKKNRKIYEEMTDDELDRQYEELKRQRRTKKAQKRKKF